MHAHPTLSEVLDELFKAAHVETKAPGKVCSSFSQLPDGHQLYSVYFSRCAALQRSCTIQVSRRA